METESIKSLILIESADQNTDFPVRISAAALAQVLLSMRTGWVKIKCQMYDGFMRRWEPDMPPSVAISQYCRDPGSGRRQCERRSTALAARVALARSLALSIRPSVGGRRRCSGFPLFDPPGTSFDFTHYRVVIELSLLLSCRGLTTVRRRRFAEARFKFRCERDRSNWEDTRGQEAGEAKIYAGISL